MSETLMSDDSFCIFVNVLYTFIFQNKTIKIKNISTINNETKNYFLIRKCISAYEYTTILLSKWTRILATLFTVAFNCTWSFMLRIRGLRNGTFVVYCDATVHLRSILKDFA